MFAASAVYFYYYLSLFIRQQHKGGLWSFSIAIEGELVRESDAFGEAYFCRNIPLYLSTIAKTFICVHDLVHV